MKVTAIIPARGGSKGVPGKNIRLLGGYPLLAYAIVAARLSRKIERIIISTDAREIADIAVEYGAEAPFLRPEELARDDSTDYGYIRHAIDWFEAHEGGNPDYLVQLRPTTPLREPRIVDAAIELLESRPEATSLRSAHPAPESPFKWFKMDPDGYFTGLLASGDHEALNLPRQAFPSAYVPDGYVDVVKPAWITVSGRLYGDRTLGFSSPVCVEVDTVDDLEFLDYELHKNDNVLWNYLKENYPKRGPSNVRI